MYKKHKQTITLSPFTSIFCADVPLMHFSHCQKVILFQCCRDTAPWPATAHHHQKTSFREGAALDVKIGRSRWVSGRVSKVGKTPVQTRCP